LDIGVGWIGILNISNVNIADNTFAAGPWCSISVDGTAIFGADDIEIHLNDFVSGQWGVFSGNTVSVDATCNWWGDAGGPGVDSDSDGVFGDKVNGNVTFSPWIVGGEALVIGTITINPVELDALTKLVATFTGPTGGTATINWGDGSPEAAGVINGTVTGSHKYASTGVFTVTLTLTITDGCGPSTATGSQYAVVYDPSDGFVTGGGWIDSPAGAYTPDASLTGPANFGFVSKYKKGQQNPTGNTEFKFKAGNLNFQSDSYDWLVIAGSKAMYKGTGTINNGTGEYKFMLSAIDADINDTDIFDVDRFRIKIWDSTGVIYDNQIGDEDNAVPATEIAGGQIVIHTGK
jgi:hypothetical protein